MRIRRASIDRTLERLSVETAAVRQDAVRRGLVAVMFSVAAVLSLIWWRHEAHAA